MMTFAQEFQMEVRSFEAQVQATVQSIADSWHKESFRQQVKALLAQVGPLYAQAEIGTPQFARIEPIFETLNGLLNAIETTAYWSLAFEGLEQQLRDCQTAVETGHALSLPDGFTITVIDGGAILQKNRFGLGTYPQPEQAKHAALDFVPLFATKNPMIISQIPVVVQRHGGRYE